MKEIKTQNSIVWFSCSGMSMCRVQRSNYESIYEVIKHLVAKGRCLDCQVWKGARDEDSLDKEWEENRAKRNASRFYKIQLEGYWNPDLSNDS